MFLECYSIWPLHVVNNIKTLCVAMTAEHESHT